MPDCVRNPFRIRDAARVRGAAKIIIYPAIVFAYSSTAGICDRAAGAPAKITAEISARNDRAKHVDQLFSQQLEQYQ